MFDTTGAKCREVDPEIFFPDGYQQPQEVRVVLSLCNHCPVFDNCYEYAMQHDLFGWWAGTTQAQRKAKQKALGIEPKSMSTTIRHWVNAKDGLSQNETENRKAS